MKGSRRSTEYTPVASSSRRRGNVPTCPRARSSRYLYLKDKNPIAVKRRKKGHQPRTRGKRDDGGVVCIVAMIKTQWKDYAPIQSKRERSSVVTTASRKE